LSLLLITSPVSRADIIFFDLNDAPLEIAAAERAAARRIPPQRVHVIRAPVRPDGRVVKLNEQEIRRQMTQLRDNGVRAQSVFISGHDGNGHFFGTHGDLTSGALSRVTQEYPSVMQSVQGLTLWGCYNVTPRAVNQYWRRAMPNVKTIGGFTLKSPSKVRVPGAHLIENYLVREDEFARAAGAADLENSFRRLQSPGQYNVADMDFAVYNCNLDTYVMNPQRPGRTAYGSQMTYTSADLQAMCETFDINDSLKDRFQCYFEARPDCPHPDPNSQDASPRGGVLRQYYNQIQLFGHCRDILSQRRGYEMPPGFQVIRLVFFENLRNNIGRLHANELAQYNDEFRRLGLEAVSVGETAQMTRAQMVERVHAAELEIQNRLNSLPSNRSRFADPRLDDLEVASMIRQQVDRTLLQLDHRCSHFSAVEESTDERSPCIRSVDVLRRLAMTNIARRHADLVDRDILTRMARAQVRPESPQADFLAQRAAALERLTTNPDRVFSEPRLRAYREELQKTRECAQSHSNSAPPRNSDCWRVLSVFRSQNP
jgi:hypothetical protein